MTIVTKNLTVKGMHCNSCEKIISKSVNSLQGIKDIKINANQEKVDVEFDNSLTDIDSITSAINKVGYKVLTDNESINKKNTKAKNIEKKLIINAIITLVILSIAGIFAYFAFFKDIDNFFLKYGYYVIYLIISVVITGTAIVHSKIYSKNISCMGGMMVGMTIGMISGFIAGSITGATTGMFYGSIYGLIIGIATGVWCGKCCGIMGILEGMMAGLMGGIMGAMTTVMLINEPILIFIPIIIFICMIILTGLAYMIYKENSQIEDINKNYYDLISFVIGSFIITMALTYLIIYGPKSLIFQ